MRKLSEKDSSTIRFLRSDKEVNLFVNRAQTVTQQEALDFIKRTLIGIDESEIYYWSITLKEDQEMIGTICLWNFSTDRKVAEIGYELHPTFQNNGYMTEALGRVIEFGFDQLELDTIEAFTHGNNESSRKLLSKYLFRLQKDRIDEDNKDNLIFILNKAKGKP